MLAEQVDDLDQRGPVDRLVRLLSRDELVRTGEVGCCQVEGVHRPKTRFGCFRLCRNLNLVDLTEPYCVLEIFLVERPFHPLLKEDRLRNDLKVDEWACKEHSIRIVEKLQCALPVRVQQSSGGDQYARVEKCPNPQALRNFRSGDPLSRAQVPGG